MKKCLLIALTALPLMAHAGLMDSLTDTMTSSLTNSAKEMAGTAMDDAANAAVKRALEIKEGSSSKEAIKAKLGAPASTETVEGLEVWRYDLTALNKISPTLAESSKVLFKDTEIENKHVLIQFDGETAKTVSLADKAKA
ncbi:hypothetical protein [Aeromonas sp. NJAU223]|uniref:hypothetical protein n=1 Tax=Aeromonas sp. NJAU223 TaxID=3115650 RepID=UPI003DA80D92